MLALVHPGGGLLSTAIVLRRLEISSASEFEVRVEYARYNSAASNGTVLTTQLLGDVTAQPKGTIRFGDVTWPIGTPVLVLPDRCATRGPRVGGYWLDSGAFTVDDGHTIVISLVDDIPFAADKPITFVLEYDE